MNKFLSLVLSLVMLCSMVTMASAEAPITLDVWYALSGSSGEAFNQIIEDFNALNTGIIINGSYSGGYNDSSTKITAALAANPKTTPDVLIGGQVTYTGAYGNFYAGDMAQADAEFNFADVFSGLWDYGIYNDRYCQIPCGISTNLMFYNKEHVAAAGLDMEANPPKTWAEFIDVCKKVQEANAGKPDFIPFCVKDEDWLMNSQIMQCGNPVISCNEDYSVKAAAWGTEECAKVAQWWQDMTREGVMKSTYNENGVNHFASGNAAFFAGSSTKIIDWTASMGDKLGAIEMPIFDVQAVAMGGNTICIFPYYGDERAQAAWTFVKFVTSSAANAKFAVNSGYLPCRASGAETPEVVAAMEAMPTYAVAFKQLAYARAYVNIDDYAAKSTALAYARQLVTEDLSYDPLSAMQESAEMYNDEAGY